MNFPTSTLNVLPHLNELKQTYKLQNFTFTKDQQEQYDMLMVARRERIQFFKETDRVHKGPKISVKKPEEVQDDADD